MASDYRGNENNGFSDEELADGPLKALSCGATLGDVPARRFDDALKTNYIPFRPLSS